MNEEIESAAPLFFLSYRHGHRISHGLPHDMNRHFAKFFTDLSENVAELVSLPIGIDPGFMDRSIDSGKRWTNELLEALGTCQIFVSLLSGPYFTSPWCGMEWCAFTQRNVHSRATGRLSGETAIVPVVWAAPLPDDRMPEVVKDVQRFSPSRLPDTDINAQYEADGIYGLSQIRSDLAYQAVVWRLAQRIAELRYTHWVEPQVLARSELRDIFRKREDD